ncbi:uncharacterized protein N7477_008615 [Penicillium maclennaniae]|uniref:uncharacterized protein n=1 Tax=Penicillium maclennaniae TaxID=1343394 RepID=UPI0025415766|nr:uncharacterized protein N7477_008615 [Penicillium maclennaniae]KAJ5666167.1 hypothetical protein N7477_008615 [Penicillium maclennaniae]
MGTSFRDKLILLSGSTGARTSSLQTVLAESHGNKVALLNLDKPIPDGSSVYQMDSAIEALNGRVDHFIIDTRSQAQATQDPIWEVPLSQWDEDDTLYNARQSLLSQVKSFLQYQIQNASKAQSSTLANPFTIQIIGYESDFGKPVNSIISKLKHDVLRLHQEASVNFLNLEPESSEPSASRIVELLCGTSPLQGSDLVLSSRLPPSISAKKPRVKIALSFDFDALSAFIGTGDHPDNNLADYSTGVFSGRVGGRRLLHMLKKHQIADKVTWFIPGHTIQTFESTVKEIVASGAEIGLHGYAHEGAYQMTPAQERDVLVKCMEVAQRLTGKRVRGYRAPMYALRETTIELLREFEFLYDSSLSHHDSQPYFTPSDPPFQRIDYSQPASTWMEPAHVAEMDARPAGHPFQGFVDVRVVEQRWKDIFMYLWENSSVDKEDGTFIFPLLMHPDTSGMAHVMGMVDRFVGWLRGWGDSVEFHTFSSIAQGYLDEQEKK